MSVFLTALITTAVITPFVRLIAIRLGVTDEPADRKFHRVSTPYLGGAAIACGLLAGVGFAGVSSDGLLILGLGLAVGTVGLWDDVSALAWPTKLAVEVPAAMVAAWFLIGEELLTGPDVSLTLSIAVAASFAAIVLLTNSFNLIDNIDAHSASVALASSIGLAALTVDRVSLGVDLLPLAIAGGCLAFLGFNLSTRFKIFLGDSGSLMLGFLVTSTAVALLVDQPIHLFALALPLLLLVPLLDTATVVVDRRRHGVSVLTAGKDHLSHRLVSLGLSTHLAVGLLAVLQLISALVGAALVEDGLASGFGSARLVLLVLPAVLVLLLLRAAFAVNPYQEQIIDLADHDTDGHRLTVVSITCRMNTGGISRHVASLAAGLRQRGHRHLVIYGSIEADEGDMSNLLDESVGPTVHLPRMRRAITPVADLLAMLQIYQLLRRTRPDAVITHAAKAGFVGRTAAWLAGVPTVVHTYHGHVFYGYFGPTRTKIYLGLERRLARLTTTIVTLSSGLQRELIESYRVGDPNQYRVIELGLPIEHLLLDEPGTLRSELGLSDDDTVIGSIGRMVPIKDLPLLIKAFADLDYSEQSYHLILAGNGESQPELADMVGELGLSHRVHFLGWRDDIANLMSSLDVLALTSRAEGTPVSIVEAIAAGTPVVATAVGGVPDLVTEQSHGTLVTDRSPRGVASAIGQTVARGRTDRAARQEIVRRFGQQRLADEMARLLFELTPPVRPGRPGPTPSGGRFRGPRPGGSQGVRRVVEPG